MRSKLEEMNHQVTIAYDPVINAVKILPTDSDENVIVVETETEYIFYQWYTTA